MISAVPDREVLLPVHNEAESIANTIREVYEVLSPQVAFHIIVCEDGSLDGTKQVLQLLSHSLPHKLLMGDERKGYSRAVVDGMEALEAEYLLCMDSDGQFDPKDFRKFWEVRKQQDMIIGRRTKRADGLLGRLMSRVFCLVYQLLYRVPVHDPSCPFVLAHKKVVEKIAPQMGEMKQGFWWEFTARVHRSGFSIREMPVYHRVRSDGRTQVYRLSRLPGIAYSHLVALVKIWHQTRARA